MQRDFLVIIYTFAGIVLSKVDISKHIYIQIETPKSIYFEMIVYDDNESFWLESPIFTS